MYVLIKSLLRNFYFVLIVAALVDKSSTVYRLKDLVNHEHLFWKREKHHTYLQDTSSATNTKLSSLLPPIVVAAGRSRS